MALLALSAAPAAPGPETQPPLRSIASLSSPVDGRDADPVVLRAVAGRHGAKRLSRQPKGWHGVDTGLYGTRK